MPVPPLFCSGSAPGGNRCSGKCPVYLLRKHLCIIIDFPEYAQRSSCHKGWNLKIQDVLSLHRQASSIKELNPTIIFQNDTFFRHCFTRLQHSFFPFQASSSGFVQCRLGTFRKRFSSFRQGLRRDPVLVKPLLHNLLQQSHSPFPQR